MKAGEDFSAEGVKAAEKKQGTPVREGDVVIFHTGWTDAHTAPEKHEAGWNEILGLLKSELETGDIPTKTKVVYRLQSLFSFALPKTTRSSYADDQGW